MENKIATFDNTVGILVRAYLNDTLIQGDCAACAVGNMVSAAASLSYKERNSWVAATGATIYAGAWYKTACFASTVAPSVALLGLHHIQRTGYSVADVVRIEAAFELRNLPQGCQPSICATKEERIIAGLLAVVDVLADIHGIDLTAAEAAKHLFVRA